MLFNTLDEAGHVICGKMLVTPCKLQGTRITLAGVLSYFGVSLSA